MSASNSRETLKRDREKRITKEVFRISLDDFESNDINQDSDSIASTDEILSEVEHDSADETEFSENFNIKKPPKQRRISSTKKSKGDKNIELCWNKLGKKLDASAPPDIPSKTIYFPKNKKTLEERVAWCFLQYFTQVMIKYITRKSNEYAELNHNSSTWANSIFSNKISYDEMKKYLGIRLALGINRCLEVKNMYSRSFPYNFSAANVLGKSRFENINSSLHCEGIVQVGDEETISKLGIYDVQTVSKIGTFLKMFLDTCSCTKNYVLSRELTLDEMMVRFQGRSRRVFSRQPKPTSMGMKIIGVTDPHGYLVNFLLSPGPGQGANIHDMVMKLASQLPKGHVIYMDNYYGNITTAISLSKLDIFCCGTFRQNRGIPEETNIDPKVSKQGDYRFMMSNIGPGKNIIAGHWYDSSIVRFVSTFHNGAEKKVERRKSGHANKVEISAPDAMYDYNIFMHGNDRADQKRKSYTIQNRSKKWWRPVFNWIFDSACINAHLLFNQMFNEQVDRKTFMLTLCNWLCGRVGSLSVNVDEHDEEVGESTNDIESTNILLGVKTTMIGNHLLTRTEEDSEILSKNSPKSRRKYCFVHKSFNDPKLCTFYCSGCERYFHLDCYFLYHSSTRLFRSENGEIIGE